MTRPTLMLVTGPCLNASPSLEEKIEAAVAGGVDAVLLRDKTASAEVLLRLALRLRAVTRGKARLIVHSNPAVAREAGADGLHLDAAAAAALKTRPETGLTLGFSVHSVEEARRAASLGADYLLGGTIFASSSHPELEKPAGLETLSALCAASSVPVLAIGGVTPENAASCLEAGAAGVAVLSPFMNAADPEPVARAYRAALGSARTPSLTVNGKTSLLPKPLSIAEFLASRRLAPELVAVEHNLEIVPRARYAQVTLAPGDTLEIVQMMAGG